MNKDYCPQCSQNTNHTVLFREHTSSKRHEDFNWSKDYEIIKCNGCDNIQFRSTYSDESMVGWDGEEEHEFYYDDKKYYPKNLKEHKILKNLYHVPAKIRVVYNETLEALKNNCYLLAGVGLRAVIEAICIEEGINGRNLEVKINNLSKNKLITEKDSNRLHSIRFLGNDSVHEMDVPKENKLTIALKIVENLINNLYLIDIDASQHLDTIITDYDEFLNLLIKKFVSLQTGDEKSIKEVLGKDFRRIESSYLPNFTQQIIDDINNNNIVAISIGQVKNSSIENSPVQHFVKS